MDKRPVFTIITICYRRLGFLKESLAAMFRQTYQQLEIVIVDNGAIPEVYDYIMDLEKKDSRVKIVHFKENQYHIDQPHHMNRVCLDAALKAATGEFIFYQSDDDIISDDYVEKMVALFEDNPACTTVAGLVKDMDASGHLLPEGPRTANFRPRYMPGHLLAFSTLGRDWPSIMFCAPGPIFSYKRKEFIQMGGFHPSLEFSALWGIVPFGVTGFDETAILYWRRHEGQLNKFMNFHGSTAYDVTMELLKEWQIEKRWEIFGKKTAQYVVDRIVHTMSQNATEWFAVSFYHLRFKACWFLFKMLWCQPYFWRMLLPCLWKEKKEFKYYLKPKFRRLFEAHPKLVERIPCLMPLQKRAFK
ncbi:MAG: glycosyltransferase family 2 protein [Candidatus Omnitrophica bacterium]|nr:glycosyltransferase family 2 protein [Candidatus Omnitrophota bacterium]MDE2223230.1 glycosyltransferase family 2 protein [Candidatus Omnitrophota bacterium]